MTQRAKDILQSIAMDLLIALTILILPLSAVSNSAIEPIKENGSMTWFDVGFTFFTIFMILIAMAEQEVSDSKFITFFRGFLSIPLLFIIGFIPAISGFNLIFCVPFLIFGLYLMLCNRSKSNIWIFSNWMYSLPIRPFLLPFIYSIYIIYVEYVLLLKFPPKYSLLILFTLFIPMRILIALKGNAKWLSFFTLLLSMGFYFYQFITTIKQAPSSMVWKAIGYQPGDQLKTINDNENVVIIKAKLEQHRNYADGYEYNFYLEKKNDVFYINWSKTDSLSIFDTEALKYNYEKFYK